MGGGHLLESLFGALTPDETAAREARLARVAEREAQGIFSNPLGGLFDTNDLRVTVINPEDIARRLGITLGESGLLGEEGRDFAQEQTDLIAAAIAEGAAQDPDAVGQALVRAFTNAGVFTPTQEFATVSSDEMSGDFNPEFATVSSDEMQAALLSELFSLLSTEDIIDAARSSQAAATAQEAAAAALLDVHDIFTLLETELASDLTTRGVDQIADAMEFRNLVSESAQQLVEFANAGGVIEGQTSEIIELVDAVVSAIGGAETALQASGVEAGGGAQTVLAAAELARIQAAVPEPVDPEQFGELSEAARSALLEGAVQLIEQALGTETLSVEPVGDVFPVLDQQVFDAMTSLQETVADMSAKLDDVEVDVLNFPETQNIAGTVSIITEDYLQVLQILHTGLLQALLDLGTSIVEGLSVGNEAQTAVAAQMMVASPSLEGLSTSIVESIRAVGEGEADEIVSGIVSALYDVLPADAFESIYGLQETLENIVFLPDESIASLVSGLTTSFQALPDFSAGTLQGILSEQGVTDQLVEQAIASQVLSVQPANEVFPVLDQQVFDAMTSLQETVGEMSAKLDRLEVNVSNFPDTQEIVGTVNIEGVPVPVTIAGGINPSDLARAVGEGTTINNNLNL